jgi:hypothetical protein
MQPNNHKISNNKDGWNPKAFKYVAQTWGHNTRSLHKVKNLIVEIKKFLGSLLNQWARNVINYEKLCV